MEEEHIPNVHMALGSILRLVGDMNALFITLSHTFLCLPSKEVLKDKVLT